MTAIEEAKDLLKKALEEKSQISPDYSEHTIKLAADKMMVFIEDALAKLREAAPTELTKWLRKAIASERYEKGDKKLQTKVRMACEIIELQAQIDKQAKTIAES